MNPPYGCSLCNVSFYYEEDIKRHNDNYHGYFKHYCFVCFKGFQLITVLGRISG
ncbi:hypothetical protein EWI30_15165 [Enterobacter cloacae]|nr:hypothetical protein EWI30_15165 [Enterobacter cloacae]